MTRTQPPDRTKVSAHNCTKGQAKKGTRTVTVKAWAVCCANGRTHDIGLSHYEDSAQRVVDAFVATGRRLCGPHTVVPLSGVAVVKDRKGRTR